MARNSTVSIIPTNFWKTPTVASELWDDISDFAPIRGASNGLSVSEDNKNIYIETALPGVDPKNIEVTFDKGVLWVKGEGREEEKEGKKYYRRASSSFSYRVSVPGEIDWKAEPTATYKNGMMLVTFAKSAKAQPKKITVKQGK